jgi:peroxiredoxin
VGLFRRKEKSNTHADPNVSQVKNDYPGSPLQAGNPAPDFSLENNAGEKITLADLRGKPVILAFYPADWSPVCGDQLALYNEILPMFEEYNAQLLGISVDNRWSHQAYAQDRNLNFPLLADFEPKGEVARKFGVYDSTHGLSHRALFVIDEVGKIYWSYLSPGGVNPGADGILSALESMQKSKGS